MSAQRRFNIPTRSPTALWTEIEDEAGPLDQIDVEGMKHALALAAGEAFIRGDSVVLVPPAIAQRMLADLKAQLQGRSLKPKHRPRKNWWSRRWEQTAVAQFDSRRLELQAEGLRRDDAIQQAASEIAPNYYVDPTTVISWWRNPARLRRK
ncbi:MAG: hypothetical protein AB7T86_02420 [Xanthobacteraceae bacterium]|uniref:hypothetical protein n=1 Tax=Pseudolabrys sp. TaxID=1960880 RepID=UPI003D0AF4AA